MRNYSQTELDTLISCPKRVTEPPLKEMKMDKGHRRNDMKLVSCDGKMDFLVFMRINDFFPENFSIGLIANPKDEPWSFLLLRCNGPHGEHTNERFDDEHPHYGFHVHRADAEFLASGQAPERFAEKTEAYASYEEALGHFVRMTNIQNVAQYITINDQLPLNFPQGDQS